MNRNNYQLGSNDPALNNKADDLMKNICFLANERNYFNHFPSFSTIDYNSMDEDELIQDIIRLETVYAEAGKHTHHKAHLYVLEENNGKFRILHNDTEYGTDDLTSAPVCGGKTALEALENAWRKWSIPPVLILNAEYYEPYVGIAEVI